MLLGNKTTRLVELDLTTGAVVNDFSAHSSKHFLRSLGPTAVVGRTDYHIRVVNGLKGSEDVSA